MMLTGRDRQLLALMADGKRDKEIARVVDLAPGYVKEEIRRAMRKLGARTRAQAAAMLLKDEI